jgi:hypothetical protein
MDPVLYLGRVPLRRDMAEEYPPSVLEYDDDDSFPKPFGAQWRKGRPEFIEPRSFNPFHQYKLLHPTVHISANFRDRNGSVRPNKVQSASFCFSITISCFHDSIRTEFEDAVADAL